jgi:hypothetical protein
VTRRRIFGLRQNTRPDQFRALPEISLHALGRRLGAASGTHLVYNAGGIPEFDQQGIRFEDQTIRAVTPLCNPGSPPPPVTIRPAGVSLAATVEELGPPWNGNRVLLPVDGHVISYPAFRT